VGEGVPVIEFQAVDKSFGELSVLRQLSFSVEAGQVVSFVGPSGSGKTTVLRLIAGLATPDGGRVLMEGRPRVAFVFQEPRLLPWVTARENIALVVRARGESKKAANREAEEWMERLDLQGFGHYYPAGLSGGMMQRVSLGRAFAHHPDILLMDEPLSGLDRELKSALLAQIKRLIREEGVTVAYVTHELPEALGLADRILVLERGGRARELDLVDRGALLLNWVASVMQQAVVD